MRELLLASWRVMWGARAAHAVISNCPHPPAKTCSHWPGRRLSRCEEQQAHAPEPSANPWHFLFLLKRSERDLSEFQRRRTRLRASMGYEVQLAASFRVPPCPTKPRSLCCETANTCAGEQVWRKMAYSRSSQPWHWIGLLAPDEQVPGVGMGERMPCGCSRGVGSMGWMSMAGSDCEGEIWLHLIHAPRGWLECV